MTICSGALRQLLATSCFSIAVVVVGTAVGWPSPVLRAMAETGHPMNMTDGQVSLMVSILYMGNMCSPLPTGYLMDRIGRKMTLQVLSVIPILSWVLVYFAKEAYMLHIARFLVGMWFGIVGTVIPMYVAEIAMPNIRGALSTIFQLATNFGLLFVFLVGSQVDYYTLTSILGAIPVIFFCALLMMPESPYWLVKQGRHDDATRSLAWLRAKKRAEVKEEIEEIEATVTSGVKKKSSYAQLFKKRGNLRALLIVQVLAMCQRASGVSSLIAYGSLTLPDGVGALSVNDCVTTMGLVLVVCVFLSAALVDRAGRRPLLFYSSIGCGAAMFIAGLWFYLRSHTDVDVTTSYQWVPFACYLVYSAGFSIGVGPVATIIQGEVFDADVKGLASGITSIVLALSSFVTNMIYHDIARLVGMYLNYWIFTGFCVFEAVFVLYCIVETKGKSLYEIQKEMNKRSHHGSQPL